MAQAADPAEVQYAQLALRLGAPPSAALLSMVTEGLMDAPGRNADEHFALLAKKADTQQAKLRARRTGS
jgi:hypothetical protein